MKKMIVSVALFIAVPAMAQSGSAVATAKNHWTGVTANLTRAAEQVPESLYAFRPVESVRTFGQLIAQNEAARGVQLARAEMQPANGGR